MQLPIGLDDKGRTVYVDSDYHLAIQGASGVGKSTLLLNLFVDFIRDGGGGCLVDLHGDLADQAIALMPQNRRRDVIWFDPSADRVPPFNPLSIKDPKLLELSKESLTMILKAFAGDAWGNETPWVIRNAITAVCEYFPSPTPVHVFRFLVEDEFRNKLLDATDSPFLKLFQKQYEQLRATEQMSKFSPAVNKEGKLMHPAILPIIGSTDSLDFLDIMNTKKIVICRFSKGKIGEDAAQILASLVASMVSIAGLQREAQKERPAFLFLVDEAGSAAHSGRFSSLLEESRKYHISLGLGFQGMHQLSFGKAVANNCSTKIIYNSSGEEAEATAKDWLYTDKMNYLSAEQITDLPRYTFYCRTFKNNAPSVKRVTAFRSAKPRFKTIKHAKTYKRSLEAEPESLKAESLMRYSRDKKKTLLQIHKMMQGATSATC